MPDIIVHLDNHEHERLDEKAKKASAMYQRQINKNEMLGWIIESGLAAPLEEDTNQEPKIDPDATKTNLREALDETKETGN